MTCNAGLQVLKNTHLGPWEVECAPSFRVSVRGGIVIRKLAVISLFSLFLPSASLAGDGQIEFIAELAAVTPESEEITVLTLHVTPSVAVDVKVTPATEIKNEEGEEIGLDALEVGQSLLIEGIFTDIGIVALEVKITDADLDFELKGVIDEVRDGRVIVVLGFPIHVPETAEIKDGAGTPLSFSELEAGLLVKVEGMVVEGELVASEVTVRADRPGFADIRFEGFVSEIPADDLILVTVRGGLGIMVRIGEDTQIVGNLAVGVRVKVSGRLGPDLIVHAKKIVVLHSIELVPNHLRMGLDEERRAVVLLRGSFDEDVRVELTSTHPDIAHPAVDHILIPAGQVTASFAVQSGAVEGDTVIAAALPADRGGAKARMRVLVGEPDDSSDDTSEDENRLEVHWRPDKIKSVPDTGFREVRLHLNHPAPVDLLVTLELTEGSDEVVAFPSEVLIPAGEKIVPVVLEFLSREGNARLQATLPEDVGGDTDTLEIDLEDRPQDKVGIQWRPDEIRIGVLSEFRVRLILSRPAPLDMKVVVSVKSGDADLVKGMPEEIEFEAGQQQVVIELESGEKTGLVRFRAALPFDLGGKHDDLHVRVDD